MNTETLKKAKELESESLNPERFKSNTTIEQIIEIDDEKIKKIEEEQNNDSKFKNNEINNKELNNNEFEL